MASFSDRMESCVQSLKTPAAICNWLKREGITDVDSVALAATTEAQVDANLSEVAKAAGVEEAKTVGGKVAIKKLWIACRELYDSGKATQSNPGLVDKPIPDEQDRCLKDTWVARHNFVLPDSYCLVETLQGKLWRDFCSTPPRLEVWLIEALRTRSCPAKMPNNLLSIVPGRPAEAMSIIADSVYHPMDFYARVRAFLMTLAYVSVTTPTWFPLQSAIAACEQILGFVMTTYGGKYPPVAFFVEAWASTIHHFSEQIRLTGRSPKEVVENVGAWEHRWRWNAQISTPSQPHPAAAPMEPDKTQKLQSQLDQMREQVKTFQSERDRLRTQNDLLMKGKGGGRDRGEPYSTGSGSNNNRYDSKGKGKGNKGKRSDKRR